jgi:mutator protein MutT
MVRFIVIVEGIIHTSNKILIVKKRIDKSHPLSGKWHFPGGKLRSKENPWNAIVREIKEEANLKVKPVKIVDTYAYEEFYKQHNTNILHIIFECSPSSKFRIKSGSDIVAVKWVRIENIRKFITQLKSLERIKVKELLTHFN